MKGKIIFVRRTVEEINIFGGDVFIDINGINVGKLSEEHFEYSLPIGKHKLKMFKTHTFDSDIGISEVEIDLQENIPLIVKYTCPMHVNSPGNIRISEYRCENDLDEIATNTNKALYSERIKNEQIVEKQKKRQKKYEFLVWIFLIIVVLNFILIEIAYG